MKKSEILPIIISIIIFGIIISFKDLITKNFVSIGSSILFATIIILVNVLSKKAIAHKLDTEISHELWSLQRFGLKPNWHLKNKIPIGIIISLFLSIISLGAIKFMAFLTYEPTALKRRAARRHGFYSYTEMTDWHIALISASGIIAVLALSLISYFIPGSGALPSLAAYYAFWNMLPISKLDGAQLFFGSRVLWTAITVISIIFAGYAFLLI